RRVRRLDASGPAARRVPLCRDGGRHGARCRARTLLSVGTRGEAVITTVINIRDAPPSWRTDPRYVYIGRAGHGLADLYGNPHEIGRLCSCRRWHVRSQALALFDTEAT